MNPQMSPQQVPEVPPIPPEVLKMKMRKEEGVQKANFAIKSMVQERGVPKTVVIAGREYPIRPDNVADGMLSRAQHYRAIATEVYEKVKGIDPFDEGGAARVKAIYETVETAAEQLAEIKDSYPNQATDITNAISEILAGVIEINNERDAANDPDFNNPSPHMTQVARPNSEAANDAKYDVTRKFTGNDGYQEAA